METRQQAEFNMAVSYLNRLNAFFFLTDEASAKVNAYDWYHNLMVLFRELSTEMKQEEINKWQKLSETLNVEVMKAYEDGVKTGVQRITPTLYFKLHNFEIELRRVLKESGLQHKVKEDEWVPEDF
jgi:hypothetical protein